MKINANPDLPIFLDNGDDIGYLICWPRGPLL